jgi:hypothetical protein
MMFLHASVSVYPPSLSRHGSSFFPLHKLVAFDRRKLSTIFPLLSGDLTFPNKQLFHDFFAIQAS